MNVEIERKYLLAERPWLSGFDVQSSFISQWYLPDYQGMTVRLSDVRKGSRHAGDHSFYLSLKETKTTLSRKEYNTEISGRAFYGWLSLVDDRMPDIEKERLTFKTMGRIWEVDCFRDQQGLVIAETEMYKEDEHIEIPSCLQEVLVREVTGNSAYYGRVIASGD